MFLLITLFLKKMFLRILTGKNYPQVKLGTYAKYKLGNLSSCYIKSTAYEVLKLKQKFHKIT